MRTLKFYKRVKAPENYPGKTYNNGNCLLHHLVWWQNTGELVPAGFVLHHKNEDKFDNRFENLELLSSSDHASQHRRATAPPPVHLVCIVCSKQFTRSPSQYRAKRSKNIDGELCCSRSCSVKNQWAKGRGFEIKPLTHGSISAYSNYGCRCEACRAGHSQRGKEARIRKKLKTQGVVA